MLITAIAVLLLYAAALVWGRGGRTFLDRSALTLHSQREYLIPLTPIPIYRSSLKEYQPELFSYLIEHGYWAPTTRGANESLTPTSHWNDQWRGGASNLQRHLIWRGDEWIAWTEEHPEIAAQFWPDVLRLIRSPPKDSAGTVSDLIMRVRLMEPGDDYPAFYRETLAPAK